MFDDKTILITGGTGSFGRHMFKQIMNDFEPKKVIIFSRDELKQFNMQQEIDKKHLSKSRFFIGDVRDFERLSTAMNDVDYVIHAAALKQVSAAEYNPIECIKTNIHGAENVIKACLKNNVKKVIALSTDKAANPINLYGATKLVSDKLFVAANNTVGKNETRFSVVRYGNVVNSRGSVVPYFESLINKGSKTLPITDLKMTRFWITLSQGVEFVIKGFHRMHGGEIFVPKIPSIRIIDLAAVMAPDLRHEIVGIRPGEKIHEIMCPRDDAHLTISFKDHYTIMPAIKFFDQSINYKKTKIEEIGDIVKADFEYNSGNNPHFLTKEEIENFGKE